MKNKIYALEKQKRYIEKIGQNRSLTPIEKGELENIKKEKIKLLSGYKIVKVLESEKTMLLNRQNEEDTIKASGIQTSIEIIKKILLR